MGGKAPLQFFEQRRRAALLKHRRRHHNVRGEYRSTASELPHVNVVRIDDALGAQDVLDRTANGTPLTTSAAVRMVGNSVSPPPIAALARANLDPVRVRRMVAA